MGENLHVCGYERCGRAFAMPVRLTNLSHKPHSQTYLACPYCFSKMTDNEDRSEDDFNQDVKLPQSGGYDIVDRGSSTKKAGKASVQKENDSAVNCAHQVGYLKTRPKTEAVPDSCLTCPRILQCMT